MSVAFRQYQDRPPREQASGRPGPQEFHSGGSLRIVPDSGERRAGAAPERIYVPPGWPTEVLPPGAPDWEASAIGWLLDQCPADYRGYPVLRRHPVVLARFAAEFVEGQIRSSRQALATTRPSLGEYVDHAVLDQAAEAIQTEGARLVRVRRAVMLVEEALRGRIFLRKL
ncbi:hypothetical protein AAEX63_06855 [Luteococcus sp. H138]|uniref:hypothetical protein n=1 Tax=unclassified Luteococcus TaxID=2639923 RepID=UPI00313DE133